MGTRCKGCTMGVEVALDCGGSSPSEVDVTEGHPGMVTWNEGDPFGEETQGEMEVVWDHVLMDYMSIKVDLGRYVSEHIP